MLRQVCACRLRRGAEEELRQRDSHESLKLIKWEDIIKLVSRLIVMMRASICYRVAAQM